MRRQIELHRAMPGGLSVRCPCDPARLEKAYERCGEITGEYAKTFYLGTQLMTPERARAIWAIYVWCRRTDELVDGPNAARITPAAIGEERAAGARGEREDAASACDCGQILSLLLPRWPAIRRERHGSLMGADQWERRLEAIFEGRPYDELDAALTDTLSQFPLDIQPFR